MKKLSLSSPQYTLRFESSCPVVCYSCSFACSYSFSPALWLEWLRDELPLADLDEALGDIRALFEKAVDDYIGQSACISCHGNFVKCLTVIKDPSLCLWEGEGLAH